MRRLQSRVLLLAAAAAVLAAMLPASAEAATVRRTWTAPLGGAGASGSAVLVRYWAGNGSFTITAHGLTPSTSYAVMVYRGRCARPTALLRLPAITTDANGDATRVTGITLTQMAPVWRIAALSPIALRVASGTEFHCSVLGYPLVTRIAVPSLGIDLPVVYQPGSAFPWCNVAMYLPQFSQPGEAGAAFIYAHARKGMFLPLLDASMVNNGASLIGRTVYAWTSANRRYTYQVIQVRRHQYTLPNLWSITSQQVWLQTSEGPYGTYNKLFVIARRVAVATVSYADAHPKPHPLVCGLYG